MDKYHLATRVRTTKINSAEAGARKLAVSVSLMTLSRAHDSACARRAFDRV
jgi:hypothetical protein